MPHGNLTWATVRHAWWRLREASGTIFFDTAPSSASDPPVPGDWTNRVSEDRTTNNATWDPTASRSRYYNHRWLTDNDTGEFDGINTATTGGGGGGITRAPNVLAVGRRARQAVDRRRARIPATGYLLPIIYDAGVKGGALRGRRGSALTARSRGAMRRIGATRGRSTSRRPSCRVGTGRDYKAAATDAFKRAAVRFGIRHEPLRLRAELGRGR